MNKKKIDVTTSHALMWNMAGLLEELFPSPERTVTRSIHEGKEWRWRYFPVYWNYNEYV